MPPFVSSVFKAFLLFCVSNVSKDTQIIPDDGCLWGRESLGCRRNEMGSGLGGRWSRT